MAEDRLVMVIELREGPGGSTPNPRDLLGNRPPGPGINIIPPPNPRDLLGNRPASTPGTSPGVDELQEVLPVELVHPLPLPVTIVGGMKGEGGGKGEGERPPQMSEMERAMRRLAAGFDSITKGVTVASSALQSLAGNDQVGALTKASLGAAQALSLIPGVGTAAASGLTAVVASIKGMLDVAGAFVERGQELSRYSPELAVANARAQVTSILDDIREAQRAGHTYADLTNAYTEFQHLLRQKTEPIKEGVAGFLAARLGEWNELLRPTAETEAAKREIAENARYREFKVLQAQLENPNITAQEFERINRRMDEIRFQGPIRPPAADDFLGQVLQDLMKQSYMPPPGAGTDPLFGAWQWGTWSPALSGGF